MTVSLAELLKDSDARESFGRAFDGLFSIGSFIASLSILFISIKLSPAALVSTAVINFLPGSPGEMSSWGRMVPGDGCPVWEEGGSSEEEPLDPDSPESDSTVGSGCGVGGEDGGDPHVTVKGGPTYGVEDTLNGDGVRRGGVDREELSVTVLPE